VDETMPFVGLGCQQARASSTSTIPLHCYWCANRSIH